MSTSTEAPRSFLRTTLTALFTGSAALLLAAACAHTQYLLGPRIVDFGQVPQNEHRIQNFDVNLRGPRESYARLFASPPFIVPSSSFKLTRARTPLHILLPAGLPAGRYSGIL